MTASQKYMPQLCPFCAGGRGEIHRPFSWNTTLIIDDDKGFYCTKCGNTGDFKMLALEYARAWKNHEEHFHPMTREELEGTLAFRDKLWRDQEAAKQDQLWEHPPTETCSEDTSPR